MTLTLNPELEAALIEQADRQGTTPEDLALKTLNQRFVGSRIQPRDDWERRLLSAASDCGVSLSNEAVSSEGIYE
jgi:hypothetical protein